MNFILAIPLPVRLAVLFVLGAAVGAAINWAAYRLAYHARAISPWSSPAAGAARRRWLDRVPILGWFGLRRESTLHGDGFWIRPLLVELVSAAGLAVLYVWQTQQAPLVVAGVGPVQPPPADFLTGNLPLVAHLRFVGHTVLIALMLAASLIDLDEKTIPDSITVPGTLVGLALAFAYPWSLAPANGFIIDARLHVDFLTLAAPGNFPEELTGLPLAGGLAAALACWTIWCGGLLPRYWNARRGWGLAVRVFWHRLSRQRVTYAVVVLSLAGGAAIVWAAARAGDARWAALLTALLGMWAGGGIIWAVRFIGAVALGREAMGFGDVTLMSMIGAFVGWQACLIIFFLAPFFGLAFAVVGWLVNREREIPYGPFLCAAALCAILGWASLWFRTAGVFGLGWIVPALVAGALVLLGVLLFAYRVVAELIVGSRGN